MRNSYASYPIELSIRYKTQGGNPITGEGRTLSISRGTLRFRCDRTLARNLKIQIVLSWPASLPDGTGLNLWMEGDIAECSAGCVEVRLGTYEFKTPRDVRSANSVRTKGANVRALTAGF